MIESRKTRSLTTMILTIVGALILAPMVVWFSTSQPAATAAADDVDWASSLSLLESTRTSSDAIPVRFDIDPAIRNTSVFLGTRETSSVWAGVDSEGMLCLVVTFDGSMNIAGRSCSDKDTFEQVGVALQANTVDGAIVAYLVPDSVAASITAAGGLVKLRENVLVGDPFEISVETRTLRGPDGAEFTLLNLGEPGDYRS